VRHYLIVANQTLGAEDLVQFVTTRARAEPSSFFIVVPATPVLEMVHGAEGASALGGSTLIPSSPEHAHELAQQRLETALHRLERVGADVDGQVGDRDPGKAVESALKGRECDEIVVSTLPGRLSRWLRQDLPRRLEHRTRLPVHHLEADT
jgi:nucleotide-binding universal stress UspA family protein